MRKAEQARLVAWSPIFSTICSRITAIRSGSFFEEADAFAPQQPMGELTRVLGEVDRIARRGRNFGFCLISITQRPAKLNKDVLTQLSTLIALGITSPQDRDAVKAWADGNADRDEAKKVYESLARLPVGEGWIWAPDHDLLKQVKFPQIKTVDTSKTPKAGEARITAPVLASADIAKITQQIQAIQATQRDGKPKPKTAKEALAPLVTAAAIAPVLPKGITAHGAAQLKTTPTNIVRLEKGRSIPSTNTLQRIAKATKHALVITFSPDA